MGTLCEQIRRDPEDRQPEKMEIARCGKSGKSVGLFTVRAFWSQKYPGMCFTGPDPKK